MIGFPVPYEDETLGSVFIRARRHTGLPYLTLKAELGIPGGQDVKFSQARWVNSFAAVTRMPPLVLLRRHTLLPYATSLLPAHVVQSAELKALAGKDTVADVGRMANAVDCLGESRYCSTCVAEQMVRLGETYWRRSHQLPGVACCSIHATRLGTVQPSEFRKRVSFLLPGDLSNGLNAVASGAERFVGLASKLTADVGRLSFLELRQRVISSDLVSLREQTLLSNLQKVFGEAYWASFGFSGPSMTRFIRQVANGKTTPYYLPLRYLVLAHFLDEAAAGLEARPCERQLILPF